MSDIRDYFLGIENKILKSQIPEILISIIKDEMTWYDINFTFTYYGVKKQLPNKKKYEDGLNKMKELMGWEKKRN